MKYTTVEIAGIITAIATITDIDGYTESLLFSQLPSEEELDKMTDKQQNDWIEQNNKLMKSVCDFLNKV